MGFEQCGQLIVEAVSENGPDLPKGTFADTFKKKKVEERCVAVKVDWLFVCPENEVRSLSGAVALD